MIPDAYIKEWYAHAPWHEWGMVEQDLLITGPVNAVRFHARRAGG